MHITYYTSPHGVFQIQGNNQAITSERLLSADEEKLPTGVDEDLPEHMLECARQLSEYFHRQREEFDLPLDLSSGTQFHQAVWKELLKIPYGRTSSYLAIAEALGDPGSVRAVGQANRHNPIAIIFPCHRVIAKSGDLQGYFYGLDMKRQLLELENPMSFGRQTSLF
jgi:methylated-DNA-[protein]-cysteine S-methyltransferase